MSLTEHVGAMCKEFAADLELALNRVFVRILGRLPTKDEIDTRARRYDVTQWGSNLSCAVAFTFDGRLILISGWVAVRWPDGASWWIKEMV